MKFSCLQENLNWGLGIVGRAVSNHTVLPIANNILFETDETRLKLVATNLGLAVSCWIEAKIEEEGTITVPAKIFTAFVESLPKEQITIDMLPRDHILTIRGGRHDARIAGLDSKDFPPIPSVDEGINIIVEIDALKKAISQVLFAVSQEDARPVLTGVKIEISGKDLTLAAADGFRLAVYKMPLRSPVDGKTEVIVPGKTLDEFLKLASSQSGTVQITISPSKHKVIFRLQNIELVSSLLDYHFPQYENLIPSISVTMAVVDSEECLRAIKAAHIFAQNMSSIVRLKISEGMMTISGKSEEVGENVGVIDATVKGPEAKIAFNGKYLIDVLSVLKGSKVAFEVNSPSSPGVIRVVGSASYVYVLMPMFVQW